MRSSRQKPSRQNNIANRLIKELESIVPLVTTALEELKKNASGLASAVVELGNLKESVEEIATILYKGNGHNSLLTRVTLLEGQTQEKKETKQISARGKWALYASATAAVISALGAITCAIIALYH